MWEVFLEEENPACLLEEKESCCRDVCSWCSLHLESSDIFGPAQLRDGAFKFTHSVKSGAEFRDVWCEASTIRERWNKSHAQQTKED